eukprot:12287973-Prorocentrum_lima.AAC.1
MCAAGSDHSMGLNPLWSGKPALDLHLGMPSLRVGAEAGRGVERLECHRVGNHVVAIRLGVPGSRTEA